MKTLIIIICLMIVGVFASRFNNTPEQHTATAIQLAYKNHQSNLQVTGSGTVIKVLPDDTRGARHQRFIIRLDGGQTLLIAHNIDLAQRLAPLSPGDKVTFSGEYVWNNKGGIIHWTHRDPHNRHAPGWLELNNRVSVHSKT